MDQAQAFKKLKTVLEWVWNNPYSHFYRDKYKKVGFLSWRQIASIEDFKKLPFLEREEIVQTSPYKLLFLPKEKITSLWISSGTTDVQNPMVNFHTKMHPLQIRLFTKKTKEPKIKAVMLLFAPMQVQGRIVREWSELNDKDTVVVAADTNNLPVSAKLARVLNIDAIETTPTILYFFIPYLKEEYDLKNIKYIFLAGEFCSETKLVFLKKFFKNACFEFIYGGNETLKRGNRCKFLDKLPPRFFHPLPIFYYEIQNPKEQSELIITHLFTKVAFPLIRYKTGDCVKIIKQNCACGAKEVMEVFGRLEYDVARVHGATIYADYVYKALSPFSKHLASLDFQLHIFEVIKGDQILPKLTLKVIPKNFEHKNLIAKGVSDNLYLSAKLTLSQLVEKGVFIPLEVEFVKEFPDVGKRKHIISHIK